MSTFTRKFVAFSTAAVLAIAPALSHAEKAAKVVLDYTVFLGPPTGLVCVKLPTGCK
jgi:hypothetical protein